MLDVDLEYSNRIIAIDGEKEIYIGNPEEIPNNVTSKKVFYLDMQHSE